MKILLGNFSVKVRGEDIFELKIRNESLHEISNEPHNKTQINSFLQKVLPAHTDVQSSCYFLTITNS
jgi:hypothetical protein